MSVGIIIWRAKQVMAQVEKKVQQNMDKAAIYMVNDVVKHFGSPAPEPAKGGGFKKNSSKAWKRGHPSASGDPPNVQSGDLWRSIHWLAPEPMVRMVGSALKYAAALEYGFPPRNLLARPYLRPALARCRRAIFRIIATGS